MPLTRLDERAALILIDLQKGIVSVPLAQPGAGIVQRAAALAGAFRERQLPVVLINVTGRPEGRTDAGAPKFTPPPDWAELVAELGQHPDDLLISKQSPGAFHRTNLDAELRQREVTQVFLAGISTSFGVESTGRSAFDLGYHVVFVTDAMTDRDADAHRHSIERVFPRIGESDTTESVLKLLRS